MRTTNLSFFRMLTRLEEKYKQEDIYPSYARNVLDKLINFVQKCNYDRSESRKFISEHFRMSPDDLCWAWNLNHPDKQKHIKTFYSQISTFSNDLYDLLGTDIEIYFTEFKDEQFGEMQFKKEIVEISTMIDALNLESEGKLGVFISDFENDLAHVRPSDDCTLADCKNEIKYMRRLLSRDVAKTEKSMDMEKAAYVYKKLRSPIFKSVGAGKHEINREKVEILKSLGILPEQYVRRSNVIISRELGFSPENMKALNEIDLERVMDLYEVLYKYFSPEGFKEFIGNYTMSEVRLAIQLVRGVRPDEPDLVSKYIKGKDKAD